MNINQELLESYNKALVEMGNSLQELAKAQKEVIEALQEITKNLGK